MWSVDAFNLAFKNSYVIHIEQFHWKERDLKASSLLLGPPARAITAPLKGALLQSRPLAIGQWLVRWYGFPLSRTGI